VSNRLEGKIALISGGARGIGAAVARMFVAEGARGLITDVLEDMGAALAADLGAGAAFHHLDVTDRAAWDTAVAVAVERFGPVNVLFNNAGITKVHRLEDLTPADLQRVTATNQFGVIYGMQAVLDVMRRNGGGSIINVASIGGLFGFGMNIAYAGTKGAVRALSRSAAIELAPDHIRVNTMFPGTVDTPMARGEGGAPELGNLAARVADQIPMKRAGLDVEAAYLATYLASEESGFCTGGEFVLDGGQTAGRARRLAL